jgi:hypothetical protein
LPATRRAHPEAGRPAAVGLAVDLGAVRVAARDLVFRAGPFLNMRGHGRGKKARAWRGP